MKLRNLRKGTYKMEEEIDIEKENFINKKKNETENYDDAIQSKRNIFNVLKNIFKQSSRKDIEKEFFDDFYQKYSKLEFQDDENIEAMKQDFMFILEYDESCFPVHRYGGFSQTISFEKALINNKEAYTSFVKVSNSDGETTTNRYFINLFIKTTLNERLHIATKDHLFTPEKFEENFFYNDANIIKKDSEWLENENEELSEEFYFQKFSWNNNSKFLELDKNVKQKLLEIFLKYRIQYYIAIKDNLMRIQIEIPDYSLESRYGLLFNMEKTFELLMEIMFEIERTSDNLRFKTVEKEYSKIKNIIFDLDNTIILDTEEDSEYYRDALINAGYTDDYFYGIYQAIDEYDKTISEENPYYNEQELLEFINEYLSQNFSMNVIDGIKETVGREWTKRILVSDEVLEYLSSKYNLYVYSNYFQEVQMERLENIGYLKYFKGVFGADKYGCKQFKKCFENVLNEIKAKPEECLMIGDDKSKDIIAANNMNMKSILFDYNGRKDNPEINVNNYFVIKDMNDLKKIL